MIFSAIGRMRRSKYLSLAGIKFDKSPLPRMWHLFPHKDEFVAKEFHPVAKAVNEEETVINCFPHIQQQLKELNRPGMLIAFKQFFCSIIKTKFFGN